MSVLPSSVALEDVDIWFQDETRIGQQGSITRVWHYTGQRPRAIRQQQFISGYIFGAVCPSNGKAVGLVLPNTNKHAMKMHMEEISQHVPKGRHAIVVMDGAKWHQPDLNQHNATMLTLPPYSPELNPIEQVWQYIKQKWLSNRCFKDFDSIVQAASDAWNNMRQQTDILKTITHRAWAKV